MSLGSKLRHLGLVLSDARWWPFYLQRRFMRPASRDRLAVMATRFRPRSLATDEPSAEVSLRLAELRSNGISHLGQLLTVDQIAELRQYFLSKPVCDHYRPKQGSFLPESNVRHPESHIAHHEARDVVIAPYLFALANNPLVLDVVSRYLGCRPTIGYLAVWWSYHTSIGAQQAENFHRDVDDWRFVKLFVYLSDVGVNNGPHIYVKQSAPSSQLRQIRRFDDSEVSATFGHGNVLELTGNAGGGFIEDTFGIHKGRPVAEGQRLIFQAVYSMFALPYGPKVPVAASSEVALADGARPDPWINRLYLSDP